MKAFKRLFWIIIIIPLLFIYGIAWIFMCIIYGGNKADNILPDIFKFIYHKLK
jgi:hypothetical protein